MSDKTLRARRIANELVEQSMEQFRRQRSVEQEARPIVQSPVVQREKPFEPGKDFHNVFSKIIGGKNGGDEANDEKSRKIHFLPPKEAYKKMEPTKTENASIVKAEESTPVSIHAPVHVTVFERLSNHEGSTEIQNPKEDALEDLEKPAETKDKEAKTEDKPKHPVSIFEKLSHGSGSN